MLEGLDRAGGLAEDRGHLGGGQPPGHAEQQHLALVGGELAQGGQHAGALEPLDGQLLGVDAPVGQGGLVEVVLQRFDPRAGLLAPVVVQVVAGDLEQPAPQGLDRAAEAGQGLDGADEGGAGEVLGQVAVGDRGHEETEQGGGVGGVDAGHGGRLTASRVGQVRRGQPDLGHRLPLSPEPEHSTPPHAPRPPVRLSHGPATGQTIRIMRGSATRPQKNLPLEIATQAAAECHRCNYDRDVPITRTRATRTPRCTG